jgi:hypothetical protein
MDRLNFKEHKFGLEGTKYVKECLSHGKTLAQNILNSLNLDAGYVVTLLPSDTDPEAAVDFEHGVLPLPPESEWHDSLAENGSKSVWVPIHNMNFYVESIVEAFLHAKEGHVCIIEENLARAGDPALSSRKIRPLIFDSEVYYLLRGKWVKRTEIEEAIKQSHTIPYFIGALTFLPKGINFLKSDGFLAIEEIKILAENAQKIFVGAYDGEGYLIWHRAKTSTKLQLLPSHN